MGEPPYDISEQSDRATACALRSSDGLAPLSSELLPFAAAFSLLFPCRQL